MKYISAFASVSAETSANSGVGYITADIGQPVNALLPVIFEKQYFDDFSASESVNYILGAGTAIDFQAAFTGASRFNLRFNLGGVLQPA